MRLIEMTLGVLLSHEEQKLLYLTEPPTLSEVESKNNFMGYYDTIIQGNLTVNLNDLRRSNFMGPSLLKKLSNLSKTTEPLADILQPPET